MPLFLLLGGEIVFLALAARIFLWAWRGWRQRAPEPGPEPDGGARRSLAVLEGDPAASHGDAPDAPLREAA